MAANYSSFAFVQFAFSIEEFCAYSPDKKNHICIGVSDGDIYIWNCTQDRPNGEWSCKRSPYATIDPKTDLPKDLKEALDKAKLAEMQANTTRDNDTNFFDRLNDRAMNEQSIESNDNNDMKVPKDLGDLNDNGDGPTTNPED